MYISYDFTETLEFYDANFVIIGGYQRDIKYTSFIVQLDILRGISKNVYL